MPVKKTIRFTNLDGESVEEDWYFSLDEADAAEMDLAHRTDLAEYLIAIEKNKDSKELLKVYMELLFASVGKRDGNLLVKDAEVRREFRYGGAYKQFFADLLEAKDGGAEFFQSIMPAAVQEKVAQEQAHVYSKSELLEMSDQDFDRVAGTDISDMSKEHMQIAYLRKTGKAA